MDLAREEANWEHKRLHVERFFFEEVHDGKTKIVSLLVRDQVSMAQLGHNALQVPGMSECIHTT